MATELGLDSITRLQKLAQQQSANPGSGTPGSWMWTNSRPGVVAEEDDSWEVRAFAEDTGSIMGTTWPPRSYTCTFCRREFRSAQALGGHMNVHRRDRARLRQSPPASDASSSSATPGLLLPHQELVANGTGTLCLLYPGFPNHISQAFPPPGPSPSTLLSISPYDPGNGGYVQPPRSPSLGTSPQNVGQIRSVQTNIQGEDDQDNALKEVAMEELDLELRLGNKSS